RSAHKVGERKMAMRGFIAIAPGLLMLAYTKGPVMLYGGLFFLAVGSSMIIPCLTSLVSFYSPKNMQGQSLGIFRSLGSLGRVIGPIYASLVYWKYGSTIAYISGTVLVLLPTLLVRKLPAPVSSEA